MRLSVETLSDLTGKPHVIAMARLKAAGFQPHHKTVGGYELWRHDDGCEVWIRPSGEVVRTAPKIQSTTTGKMYRPRYDQHGKRTQEHHTGEIVEMPKVEDE